MDEDFLSHESYLSRREMLRWVAAGAGTLMLSGPDSWAAKISGLVKPDWDALRDSLGAKLVLRTSSTYEDDRQSLVWSAAKPARFPDAIVHVSSEDDILETIRFAGENGLKVAIRGGGHHFNSPSIRNGGLVVDLSALKSIAVEPDTQTAMVGPGVTARELMAVLAQHDLAFPVGHCGSVPLSGYLLNGGFGWNSGTWGPACLSVQGLDVVTAGAKSIYCDADSNPDLFWAARGAGMGFFGVVTRYHLKLYSLPQVIRTSTLIFEFDDADAVADWLPTFQGMLPPQVELACLVVAPPQDSQSQNAQSRLLIVTATAFADDEADAKRWLAPLEAGPEGLTPISKSASVETSFEALFQSMDAVLPANHRYASDHAWTNATPKELFHAVRDAVESSPSQQDFLLLAFGPNRPPDAPPLPKTALTVPGRIYAGVYAVWNEPNMAAKNRAWVHSMSEALAPHKVGSYIGETDVVAAPDRPKECFSREAWERLGKLKRKFDPTDVFFSYALNE